MTRDELLDVLEIVAAAKSRTIGNADLVVWQEIIGHHPYMAAVNAVKAHLTECPGVWLEPGHVHQRILADRRAEVMSESRESREARQDALSAKAAVDPMIAELGARMSIPPTGKVFTRRGQHPALSVACPWCKAGKHRPCHIPGETGDLTANPHPSRVELATGADSRPVSSPQADETHPASPITPEAAR